MADPSTAVSKTEVGRAIASARTIQERRGAFYKVLSFFGNRHDEIHDLEIVRAAWADTVAAANRHYEPGRLTTFIGYEFTIGPERQNLHRNVIFRGSEAPALPFTRFDSQDPEDLWRWMDAQREKGLDALAIPHNSNASNGRMFERSTFEGEPMDARYASLRMRNEPLVEVTQVKGTSETHPLLAPSDEWADFEIVPFRVASRIKSNVSGSYVREALLGGLELEAAAGFNPFRFGMIGSSDGHNGTSGVDEEDFAGKLGLLDSDAVKRGVVPSGETREGERYSVSACPETVPRQLSGEDASAAEHIWCGADAALFADEPYPYWSAAGLAGVWAETNSRDAIFDALRRREAFATSGPRISVRFVAAYDLDPGLVADLQGFEKAHAVGVAMGGELSGRSEGEPRFLVSALRDPRSAPLQRLQVVKGWLEGTQAQERVYDVSCADGLEVDRQTHRCPDNGATVDLSTCKFSEDRGDGQLSTLWKDPHFDPQRPAFYYVRVLENPTCRWSTWDALRAGVAPRSDLDATIQERAWTSPIWFRPAANQGRSGTLARE